MQNSQFHQKSIIEILLYDRSNFQELTVKVPKRIISLVPSLTEYLHSLGLNEQVLGLTKFCVHPEGWKREKHIVGGTKNLRMQTIRSLNPDLIIANKEENEKNQVLELAKDYPVYLSVIGNFEEAINELTIIAHCCNRTPEGKMVVSQILNQKKSYQIPERSERAVYLIWKNPWMTVGGDTFIHHMMSMAGYTNVFADQERYPSLEIEELKELEPEYVLLSSEPFLFKMDHVRELKKELPNSRVWLVDGELFSWYGSRLIKSFSYFKKLQERKSR